jgi:hypothetical protein
MPSCIPRHLLSHPTLLLNLTVTKNSHVTSLVFNSSRRAMSAHAFPTYKEMETYLAPVAARIAKYRLDLETNPAVLDKLAAEGKISQHTADFFKSKIVTAQRSIGKCLYLACPTVCQQNLPSLL